MQNPIAMAWDAKGRMWVAENYTYAGSAQHFDLGLRDRVIILEDKDNDGKAESRKVFTDDVQMLTSVEIGRGGVWLMCPPQLLFIPDKNARRCARWSAARSCSMASPWRRPTITTSPMVCAGDRMAGFMVAAVIRALGGSACRARRMSCGCRSRAGFGVIIPSEKLWRCSPMAPRIRGGMIGMPTANAFSSTPSPGISGISSPARICKDSNPIAEPGDL